MLEFSGEQWYFQWRNMYVLVHHHGISLERRLSCWKALTRTKCPSWEVNLWQFRPELQGSNAPNIYVVNMTWALNTLQIKLPMNRRSSDRESIFQSKFQWGSALVEWKKKSQSSRQSMIVCEKLFYCISKLQGFCILHAELITEWTEN